MFDDQDIGYIGGVPDTEIPLYRWMVNGKSIKKIDDLEVPPLQEMLSLLISLWFYRLFCEAMSRLRHATGNWGRRW